MARDDEIRELAYRLWEEAGKPHGPGHEFWLEAERQLEAGRSTNGARGTNGAAKPKAATRRRTTASAPTGDVPPTKTAAASGAASRTRKPRAKTPE